MLPEILGLVLLSGVLAPSAETEPAAGGEEPEPAAVIYETATVNGRALGGATAAVTVIGRQALDEAEAGSIIDALAFVPGLTLVSGGTRGGLTLAQIRGGDPNYTRVLVDGVPVHDGTYQIGGVFNLEALPVDAVEQVEVVRGPFSSIYGSTGLSGVIQVITRRGEGAPKAGLRLGAGDADDRSISATLGASLGASTNGSEGAGDYFVSLSGEGEEGRIADERFELYHLQGQARWLRDRGSSRLSGRFASWEGDDYPDASGGPVFGSGELRTAENREAGLGWRHLLTSAGGDLHRVDASFYRHDLDRESPAVFPLVPPSVEETRISRGRLGWSRSSELAWGAWSLGADVEHERAENESLLLLPPFLGGAVAGDYDVERTTSGVYSEWTHRQGSWSWDLGLRADVPEGRDLELSPRLGIAYALPGGKTRLVASAGRAFKLPSFFALVSPPALGGNPDLEPELATGGDVGFEYRPGARRVLVSVRAFAQRYRDLVDFDFETFSHVNRSRVKARGIELAAQWRPTLAWRLAVDLTWQDVEDAAGAAFRHRPEWNGALRASWRPGPKLRLHADLRFRSSQLDEQIPVPDRRRVAGYELLGLAAGWKIRDDWRLSLRLDNLADEDYETLIGFPGPGRSGRLTLAWSPER